MSLKNLIALQNQKKSTSTPTPEPKDQHPVSEGKGEAESPKEEPEQAPAPAKPKGLGLNTAGSFKKPNAPVPTKTPASAKPKPAPTDSSDFTLEDLAGMEASSVAVDSDEDEGSEFADEIEATAPDRDLAPDLSAEQLAFIESLDGVYQVLHDPDMFGQAVRLVMLELQENQEYDKLLADSDIHVMIRGMRRTMGLARVKKQSKSRKANTNKNARKKAAVSDDAMALLNSLMPGGDD